MEFLCRRILFAALLWSATAASAAELDPRLVERIARGDADIPVVIVLKDIPRHSIQGMRGHPRHNRPFTLGRLNRNAREAQGSVTTFLGGRFRGRVRSLILTNSVATRVSAEEALALAARGDVEQVFEDRNHFRVIARPHLLLSFGPSLSAGVVVPFSNTAGLDLIRVPQAWATYGVQGGGAKVGNIDTGVDRNHPDLAGKIITFRDFVSGQALSYDDDGHGTHTAGTHSGGAVSGTAIGVAPTSRLLVAKALSPSGGTASNLLAAMDFMADPDGNPATDDAPDVVSNSWGSPVAGDTNEIFRLAVQRWVSLDIFPSMAAGNDGPGASSASAPGNYPEVFSVGAIDALSQIADFSGRGPSTFDSTVHIRPDATAPGVSVNSARAGGGYVSFDGTSMACPHVTGLVALMRSYNPNLTVAQMKSALQATAVDLGTAGKDNAFGAGRVDAMNLLGSLTPSLSITNPGPGGGLIPGVSNNVTWTLGGGEGIDPLIATFDVALSLDSGTSFPVALGTVTGNQRTIAFTPSLAQRTTTARLRVIGRMADTSERVSATSLADFPINSPPVVPALPDRTVLPGDVVTLDASATSDGDLDSIFFSWTQTSGPTVGIVNANTPVASITAGSRGDRYVLRVAATDLLQTSTRNTTVTVNRQPVANAGPDQIVRPAATVTMDARSSSDPDGAAITYAWTQLDGPGAGGLAPAARPTFTASATRGATVTFDMSVSDGVEAASDTVGVTVNRLPVVSTGGDLRVRPNLLVTLRGSASRDPDGSPLTYSWVKVSGPVIAFPGSIADPSFFSPPTRNTTLTFDLTCGDGLEQATRRVNVHINQVPVARAVVPVSVAPGATVTLNGSGSTDGDGDPITHAWTQVGGTGVSLSGTAASPTFVASTTRGTTASFDLVVDDGLESSAVRGVTVRVNSPPVVVVTTPASVLPGRVVTLDTSSSTDLESDPLKTTWTQTAGPTVTLNATATSTSFVASSTRGTVYRFDADVSDGSEVTRKSVTVTVNQVPVVRITAPALLVPETTATLDAAASSDPDGSTLRYTWKQVAGDPLSIDTAAAAPTFSVPAARGARYSFSLEVTDGLEKVTVPVDFAVNRIPLANAGKDQVVRPDARVTIDASASKDLDGEVLSYTWSQISGPAVGLVPGGPSLEVDLTGVARGTELAFALAVRDGLEVGASSVKVRVNRAPDPGAARTVSALPGESLTVEPDASDPDGDPLKITWKQVSGPPVSMQQKAGACTFITPAVGKQTVRLELVADDGVETATVPLDVALTDRTYESSGATTAAGCEARHRSLGGSGLPGEPGPPAGPVDASLPVLWLGALAGLIARSRRARPGRVEVVGPERARD